MSKKDMKEMSSTGGGAPAADQGHANVGSGEGMAMKFGFKKKKKKKVIEEEVIDLVKEYKRLFKKGL
jgi:hypothetical protein